MASQVLQTKMVSPAEVIKKAESWKDAIQAEIDSFFAVLRKLRLAGGTRMYRRCLARCCLVSKLLLTG